jgi:hypothetical protein
MIARLLLPASVLSLLLACGGSKTPARAPAPTEGPALTPRELGTISTGQCQTTPYIQQIGAGCTGLPARNASGTNGAAGAAADGDVCTIWNSGGVPPQAIIIDLERDTTFNGLLLVPEMTPPEGDVLHVIERSMDGDTWTPVGVIKAHMVDDHVYAVTFPAPVTARAIRITTNASPSWVAWSEADPVRCG